MVMLGSVHLVIKREQEISRGSVSTLNFPLKIPTFFHGCYRKNFPLKMPTFFHGCYRKLRHFH